MNTGIPTRALPGAYYSSASDGDLAELLGAPHYSYRFAEAKFLQMFEQRGVSLARLKLPEYYASNSALTGGAGPADDHPVHLIFRSTEQIRLLKFGFNIACFAWEFSVLKTDTRPGEHPFLNQKRMLSLCDEIWTPSTFAERALQSHGLENVHVIPAPVTVPGGGRLDRYDALVRLGQLSVVPLVFNFLLSAEQNRHACQTRILSLLDWLAPRLTAEPGPTLYLTILNPEDFRKNLDSLLRGFYHFQKEFPGACLLVKVLTSATRFSLAEIASDVVPNKLASGTVIEADSIILLNGYLTESELSCLYYLCDFYLCASSAEGQNLPLLEAMAHGTVPVTTRNTAMSDYIDSDNAFVIRSTQRDNDNPHMAGTAAGRPFKMSHCTPRAVYEALKQSRAATAECVAMLARNAIDRVTAQYAPGAIWPLVAGRLAHAAEARAHDAEGDIAEGDRSGGDRAG